MRKKQIISILLITLSFLITSCKDNPVIVVEPPPPTPTNDDIYTWKVLMHNGQFQDIYAADSENVYVNDWNRLLKLTGDTLVEYPINDPNFEILSISGHDKDNIFLGGHSMSNPVAILKKIQYGNIINYPLPNEPNNSFYDVLCEGQNDVWLSTIENNKLYHFNSGNFQEYSLHDSVCMSYFHRDATGILYAFGVLRRGGGEDPSILFSYKFNGNRFDSIRTDTVYSPFTGQHKSDKLYRCGTDLMMLNSDVAAITRFSGTDWVAYLSYPPEQQFVLSHIGGTSKDNLILFAAYNWLIYIWDGSWHKENSFKDSTHVPLEPFASRPIVIKDNYAYISVSDWMPNHQWSYFLVGRKNKITR